jgi:DhnA family fructose-bisphosphate aldolase class Ia
MLMSASVGEDLVKRNLFKNSSITPAIRMNDTTDIWLMRNGNYRKTNPRPFRSAQINKVSKLVNLGLFSVTFSNNVDYDLAMLNAYKEFRIEASKYKFKHFLEVFNSPIDLNMNIRQMGDYVNDCIIKAIAGQTKDERPLFLKIAYNGPKAMEELANFDPENLIVGILGGSKGTTRDCFELIKKASQYGAKVALFGRKINLAEDPILLVKIMREVVENNIKPKDAVKLYHSELKKNKLIPDRKLLKDVEITEKVLKL